VSLFLVSRRRAFERFWTAWTRLTARLLRGTAMASTLLVGSHGIPIEQFLARPVPEWVQ
jgi:hypothetical protein